jgi:hypothetical protein
MAAVSQREYTHLSQISPQTFRFQAQYFWACLFTRHIFVGLLRVELFRQPSRVH